MGLYKDLHGSRYMMQLFIIKLVCFLGWLSAIAFGQLELSETVSGAVSFPDLGITCLGNVAVFFSSFLRRRLYLELGAKDALTMLTGPIKLKKINGWEDTISNAFGFTSFGFTTCGKEDLSDCCVVMLSHETPNSSMRQFVEYIANVHHVRSVLLKYIPLHSVPFSLVSTCNCDDNDCGCIVFWAPKDATMMVAEQIPGTLKRLSDSLCLLPSIDCLKNGSHGCNQGLLHVVKDFGKKELTEGDPEVTSTAAVCGISYSSTFNLGDPATCICIPVLQESYDSDRGNDRWTKLLIGYFKSKDYETRGAIIRREKRRVSDDLENYMDKKGDCYAEEEYSIVSLIVPRLAEIVINLILTFWFKVDGFSSSLVARRAVRDYIVDGSGRCFAGHVFINKAEVRSSDNHANAYQVLSFRRNLWNPRALSVIVGLSNLGCSITWAVLVAMEGGRNKWYHTHSMAPSKGRLIVIFVGIAIALAMDCVDLYFCLPNARSRIRESLHPRRWLQPRKQTDKQQELLDGARMTDKEKQQQKEVLDRKQQQQEVPDRARMGDEKEKLDRARMGDEKERLDRRRRKILIVCTMIVFEILCIVSISVVARALGVKAFGKWVYSGVQGLVWLKWGIGNYLLGQYIPPECSGPAWTYGSTGIYMYSSAFGLNAILAGARAKWEFF